ncbi:hypothetical protein BGZ61DRAFT_50398 [Ilyonectria robusta]|uniref:uncharacterized protein n=1 Tax=Ilyonectria robusta TaxID=1079257 RepID=UPI001E8CF356|nr:uncharacterized protein BGZ61DRAFT_50398 [Ilyonectria robusta]KAH8687082.1 hypothetical protein BGZ61DRAFT_50398 [Ilyonectria robusta]
MCKSIEVSCSRRVVPDEVQVVAKTASQTHRNESIRREQANRGQAGSFLYSRITANAGRSQPHPLSQGVRRHAGLQIAHDATTFGIYSTAVLRNARHHHLLPPVKPEGGEAPRGVSEDIRVGHQGAPWPSGFSPPRAQYRQSIRRAVKVIPENLVVTR